MSYRPPIVQTNGYAGVPMQQPVVVSQMPYQQAYYANYPNRPPQNVKIVNQPNIVKNANPVVNDYHIDYSIRNQMSTLQKLIEHAQNLKNLKDNCSSPFEVRWRCVTNPFPSFWKFENDQIFNISENFPSDFTAPNEQNINMNYQKINEPRIQPNISTIPTNQTPTLSNNPAYNNNVIPPPRSQSPQVSVVATNFIPQRQPSPEIVVNGIPPKNIMTNPNYNNGIPPSNIIIPNNNISRNVNDYEANNTNPINSVTINNIPTNNYNNPINSVTINNAAASSSYAYSPQLNNPPYNPNNFVPNANYNDPNNYNNGGYNNNSGYNNYNEYNNSNANANNGMYANGYNKGYANYNNPNNNIGYRKQSYKPNAAAASANNNNINNKKHNPRKRSRGGSQWTYKPGDQE